MNTVIIAVVRKVLKSYTYFISVRSIPADTKLLMTIAPTRYRWGARYVDIIKRVGRSVLGENSRKIVIPKPVIDYLGISKGDYVWVRFMDAGAEPELPRIPFIAERRKIHSTGRSIFFIISRTYLDELARTIKYSGWVYVAFRDPGTGEVVRFITRPRLYDGSVYHLVIPGAEIGNLDHSPAGMRGVETEVVIAPLPEGFSEKIVERPPRQFPL